MMPTCPACGGSTCTPVVSSLRDRYRVADQYRVLRCRDCRLAFTDPVCESYPQDYEPYQYIEAQPRTTGTRGAILRGLTRGWDSWWTRALLFLPSIVFRVRDRMKVHARDLYVRPFRRRGRLLDIGCGGGDTLKAWINQQDQCVGLETDPRAAALARERLGIDVHCGNLEDQDFPPASFDVITLSHVLEHVSHPGKTLAQCARLLRPEGELLIWVPNFDSPLRTLFGAQWFPYEVPRHRWHFRPADLLVLLRQAGFSLVDISMDSSEYAFRKSARSLGGWRSAILRRRIVRILLILACRLFRRTDGIRILAVPMVPKNRHRSP